MMKANKYIRQAGDRLQPPQETWEHTDREGHAKAREAEIYQHSGGLETTHESLSRVRFHLHSTGGDCRGYCGGRGVLLDMPTRSYENIQPQSYPPRT